MNETNELTPVDIPRASSLLAYNNVTFFTTNKTWFLVLVNRLPHLSIGHHTVPPSAQNSAHAELFISLLCAGLVRHVAPMHGELGRTGNLSQATIVLRVVAWVVDSHVCQHVQDDLGVRCVPSGRRVRRLLPKREGAPARRAAGEDSSAGESVGAECRSTSREIRSVPALRAPG